MAYRSLTVVVGFLLILWGCSDDPGGPRSGGGSSGSGATAGSAGSAGTGGSGRCVGLFGCGGTGGLAGSGGTAGSGGAAGSGGSAGSGGTAGSGGSGGGPVECTTSILCRSCPNGNFCETNGDCSTGLVCIETGCDYPDGAPVKQCVFAGGGACLSDVNCQAGRECIDVPGEGKRCVKITPGCDTSFDCVLGFACENGSCVDRRVPCDLDEHCPKNHVCSDSSFCLRIQRSCEFEFNCVGLAPRCEDIDGDLKKECAGAFDPNADTPVACTNSQCGGTSPPVCEAAGAGSTTQCGEYGLCLGHGDCATNFSCVALWPDGRMECVPDGGSERCTGFADCPVQQVCASPRGGGVPSCQKGFQP